MAGLREIMTLIPPVLVSQLSITTPPQSLATARILNSIDPTYGTVGWVPPQDGNPFAVLELLSSKEKEYEANRIRAIGLVSIFFAIEHADTPTVAVDYHDRQLAWMDSVRQVVAANRRLASGSLTLYPQAGDVRWQLIEVKMIPQMAAPKPLLGSIWRGIECLTNLEASIVVNYQF
jgi:hypothetical protein